MVVLADLQVLRTGTWTPAVPGSPKALVQAMLLVWLVLLKLFSLKRQLLFGTMVWFVLIVLSLYKQDFWVQIHLSGKQ